MADKFFLRLDGIKGESTDAKHKGEIDVESFSWGLSTGQTSVIGGGGGASKASFNDLHFVARTSVASPILFVSAAAGKHLKDALLTIRRGGDKGAEFLKIALTDTVVTAYNQSDSVNADGVVDQFSLQFSTIDFSYQAQKADGSLASPVRTGWDIGKQTQF